MITESLRKGSRGRGQLQTLSLNNMARQIVRHQLDLRRQTDMFSRALRAGIAASILLIWICLPGQPMSCHSQRRKLGKSQAAFDALEVRTERIVIRLLRDRERRLTRAWWTLAQRKLQREE